MKVKKMLARLSIVGLLVLACFLSSSKFTQLDPYKEWLEYFNACTIEQAGQLAVYDPYAFAATRYWLVCMGEKREKASEPVINWILTYTEVVTSVVKSFFIPN